MTLIANFKPSANPAKPSLLDCKISTRIKASIYFIIIKKNISWYFMYKKQQHRQHMNIQEQYLHCNFCLVGHPFLKQVSTLRWFPMEAILECLVSVRQLDKNK